MPRLADELDTFREGLLCNTGFALTTGFWVKSIGMVGEEGFMLLTLAVLASLFSWELEGSIASLLGTGVTVVVRLGTSIELALVVSLRHWGDVSLLLEDTGLVDGEGVAPLAVPLAVPAAGVFEKKPRMLRCLPVEGAFLVADDGAFAGVRAAVADFSTILPCTMASCNDPKATNTLV